MNHVRRHVSGAVCLDVRIESPTPARTGPRPTCRVGASVADQDAPVRACYRYISNRPNFLDYQRALAVGLPIGSGAIESAHRYVIQNRLKRAGAWWTLDNLHNMLALRVLRANREWDEYWNPADQPKAA